MGLNTVDSQPLFVTNGPTSSTESESVLQRAAAMNLRIFLASMLAFIAGCEERQEVVDARTLAMLRS